MLIIVLIICKKMLGIVFEYNNKIIFLCIFFIIFVLYSDLCRFIFIGNEIVCFNEF